MRDMTEKQFADALWRRGWKRAGFLGCVDLGGVSVSYLNAPSAMWRSRLAYLIEKADEDAEAMARKGSGEDDGEGHCKSCGLCLEYDNDTAHECPPGFHPAASSKGGA